MRVFVLLLLISASALADDAALLRCRGIADPAARLACYDALPVPAVAPAVVPAVVPNASGATPAQRMPQPAKPVQEMPQTGTSVQGELQSGKAGQAGAQQTPDQFGLEQRAVRAAPDRVESRISGLFEGWEPGAKILLANGQVWQVVDDSRRPLYLNNPKVTIRRGVLGVFYLEIEGTNHTARVRRLQ
jgi:hypothetical protein